jgi:flagellar hook protein FlgE
MVRSLYSGISGLRNEQIALDVIGNNIANVNTTGFKAGRVTFEESMSQLLRGSSRPPGNAGGTNPMQVGLGMSIGSIDTILTQGNLQSTGQVTDLALEGRAYFVFNGGEGNFYSRSGAMQMDSTGRLVSPTNGFVLQGVMAADDGTYPAGSVIGDVRVPYGQKAPAQDTTSVRYRCNLDSDSEALGSVVHTNRFLAEGEITDLLTDMFDANGNDLGIQVDDIITFSGEDGLGNTLTSSYVVTELSTVTDLRDQLNNFLGLLNPANAGAASFANGVMTLAPSADVNHLMLSTNRPTSSAWVSNAFTWGPTVPAGVATNSAAVRVPATATDAIDFLYDANGNGLGLEAGDQININGSVGNQPVATVPIVFAPGMTMQDLLDGIQQAFNLPQFDGTPQNRQSVAMDSANLGDDRTPDGAIVVRGRQGLAFSLDNMSVGATNADPATPAPTRFISNMVTTPIQSARDVGQHSTSITVYDESGDAHIMTTTFTHSGIPGEWLWEISTQGGEMALGGNTGRVTFSQDGSPAAWIFDDGSTNFRFDPMNGSNVVSVQLDAGHSGSFEGITQFRSPSTTAAWFQDGYPMGKLEEISVDESGEIQGLYSNGVTQSIARIYVAEFNNPAGLFKKGDSMYAQSNNSGEPVMLRPGIGSTTKIKPGALEMSNVELATEFTSMITTQRGYQAAARVITTSDNMLQELVNLVR